MNEAGGREREKKKEQQQHMQADLYIFVPKIFIRCLTCSSAVYLRPREESDSQKCVIRPQLHFQP